MVAEVTAQIDVAINRLPERLRQVSVLCDLQGYSLKEAAAHLACPVGTVESRLARARRRLRGLLTSQTSAVGGFLAVGALPAALRAAAVRTAMAGETIKPAIAALAARAACQAGWGRAVPGLAAAMAAVLVAAAVALGHPDAPTPVARATNTVATAGSAPTKGPLDAARGLAQQGTVVRLGSSRFRHAGFSTSDIVFSPDGQQVAVGDTFGVSVFQTQTGKCLHRFPLAEGYTTRIVRFVARGKQLAIGSQNWKDAAQVTLMDLSNGKQVGTARFTSTQRVYIVDVAEDGQRVLVQEVFRRVFLWDIAASKEIWSFDDPQGYVLIPLTPDGKSLVVAGSDKAELRDGLTGKVVAVFPLPGPKYKTLTHAWGIAPDGRLAVVSEDGEEIAIVDAHGAKAVRTYKADHPIYYLLFSPDGRWLAGFSSVGTLVWDLTAPAGSGPVAHLPGTCTGGFSETSKVLALDDVGAVSLWSTGDWKLLPQSADPISSVHDVCFSPDGKHVFGSTQQGWVSWPVQGGPGTHLSDSSWVYHDESRVYRHDGLAHLSADARVGVDVLHVPVRGHGNGKYILRVTDLATGKARRIELDRPVLAVAMSPDGRFVSALLEGSEFGVWDARTGKSILRQKRLVNGPDLLGAQPANDGKSVARSVTAIKNKYQYGSLLSEPGVMNQRQLIMGPEYSAVYLNDHVQKRQFALHPVPWSVHGGGVRFSADGSKVIIAGTFGDYQLVGKRSDRNGIVVWDVRSGRLLLHWHGSSGGLGSVQLSPDGRSMTIADADGKLVIVEIASGKERASLEQGMTLSAAFNADGTKVVASSPEAPVHVWDLLGAAPRWDASKANALWADLASTNARTAFTAMQMLRAHPAEAMALLQERVKSPAVPPEAKITAWLKQLDSPSFQERNHAQKELIAVAELIPARLEAARKGASLEVVHRLDLIQASTREGSAESLRIVRTCEVLEGIGTAQAAKLLTDLADGPAEARWTKEARESVTRLAAR
jgi:WD40 repeat protein